MQIGENSLSSSEFTRDSRQNQEWALRNASLALYKQRKEKEHPV